jgi:hypothetical protein
MNTIKLFGMFDVGYSIRKVQESQEWMKLNGNHQGLISADKIGLLEESTVFLKKSVEGLLEVS